MESYAQHIANTRTIPDMKKMMSYLKPGLICIDISQTLSEKRMGRCNFFRA
jgi:hypothetical protein